MNSLLREFVGTHAASRLYRTRRRVPHSKTCGRPTGAALILEIIFNRGGRAPLLLFLLCGCTTLFGWDIHAPGILSENAVNQIHPLKQRIALYLPKDSLRFVSRAKGGRLADPQAYHLGEAFGPMLLEVFQQGFSEFILMEAEPTPQMLKRYGLPYLAVVRIKGFENRVTLKGQAVSVVTETAVFDSEMKPLIRFESKGASDARKVFAKKGGPEVNLNAALENNVLVLVQYLQDWMRNGTAK